jgi:hypothetical protein
MKSDRKEPWIELPHRSPPVNITGWADGAGQERSVHAGLGRVDGRFGDPSQMPRLP